MTAHPVIRSWGSLVLQGAVAVLFGLLFLFAPLPTLLATAFLFGAFALADGVLALISIFSKEKATSGWLLALYGALGIAAGLAAFAWPGLTIGVLATLVAAWALIIGAVRIASAIALRQEMEGEWLLALSGAITIAFALYVLFAEAGLAALVLAIGIFALVRGVVLIASGLRLRRLGERIDRATRGPRGEAPGEERRAA